MKSETKQHICALLTEALRLLDAEDQLLAAIQVSQAMEQIGCPVSELEYPDVARA